MLLGRLSTRERRFVVVPLVALVFSFILYYQEYLHSARSTKSVPIVVSSSVSGRVDPQPVCVPPAPKRPAVLLSHTYRDDGILEVNPDGSHPIYELIELANARWKSKLSRASKTLDEAVREYEKRYRRRPPKGFDKWWRYVKEHDIKLPDEYDQIYKDLEPFWGYHPLDLQRLQDEQEFHTDTFTLGTNETNQLEVLRVSFASGVNSWNPDDLLGGARSIIEILKDVEQDLPPFRAVISPHDSPSLFSDYEVKKMALDAASSNTYMDVDSIAIGPPNGWLSGCSPTSRARQGGSEQLSQQKTFIHDHRKAMDPCRHPYLLESIGEFLKHEHPGPSHRMLPRFAYCATLMHHDIQIPTLFAWVDDVLPRSDDPQWDQKLDERLVWRGSNTGIWHAQDTRWQKAQRTRLVDLARDLNGTVKVLLSSSTEDVRVGEGIEIPRGKVNPAMMDVAFAGEPVGCHEETCLELRRRYEWRRRQGSKESGQFKYIIDVDGNAWSSRFKRLITSNSLVFKATVYPEWFFDRIEPWVHYVPVQVDYSDVYDALAFFRGGLYGEDRREELARTIANEGRAWSRTFWRKEDITAYVYRLILEYARVMSSDRDAMSYDG
ncbi:hypothetical protein H2248_003152 [Termitomyces sp. 'cryptogamus']|nr:hypothetical protein H2248_003152 [Termitomyces sp. 'cryptogamus']